MKKCTTLLIMTALMIPFLSSAQDAESDAFSKDIAKLFELNGSQKTYAAIIPQILNSMKGMRNDVPDEAWKELEKEFLGESVTELNNLLIPIYKKHFTHEDVKGMIAFFESPIGKKLAEKTPVISQESMAVGQQWGMQIGTRVGEKLSKKGY